MSPPDSRNYLEKKKFFSKLLTIYGRKPVLEALSTRDVDVFRLHLAESNSPAKILDDILALAKKKQTEICFHSRDALARISKNRKQDQGVALDVKLKSYRNFEEALLGWRESNFDLIALDGISNPQNLGMIIRSVCASPMTGLLIPSRGCAKLDALVIKASAGTLLQADITRCDNLAESLRALNELGARITGLDSRADSVLAAAGNRGHRHVFVLGNETEGLCARTREACTDFVKIPMCRGVESLNVAVTAGIIAFRSTFEPAETAHS